MINLKGKRDKKNTIDVLAEFEYDFYLLSSNIAFYKDNGDTKVRDAAIKADEFFETYEIDVWMRKDLYEAILAFKKQEV